MLEKKKRRERIADLSLLCVAIIWGACFPFLKACMNAGMSAEQCMSVKFVIAAVLVSLVFRRSFCRFTGEDMKAGLICGGVLFVVNYLTTIGLAMTSPANCAIIATTYVLMIPFIWFFMGKAKLDLRIFGCAVLCILGLIVMNYSKVLGLTLGFGDLIVFLGAVFCALQIVYVGHRVESGNAIALLVLQMIVCAILSSVVMVLRGEANIEGVDVAACILPMLFVGVLGVGVAFGAQVLAQQYTTPAKAGLLMATEGTFGAIISVIMGFLAFSASMVIGTLCCFLSVIVAELFSMGKLTRRKNATVKAPSA